MIRKAKAGVVSKQQTISTVAYADAMPPDIAEKIEALGRVIAVPQTDAIYAPLHPMEPYPGVNVARDVRYGPADLNVLDVFTAENAAGGTPVASSR